MSSGTKDTESVQTLPSWQALIDKYSDLLVDRNAKKEQGMNDFNLLGSLLSANDEVRLHTRFLFSLLNPNGRHYRGTRFLELFMKTIGREGWLNLNSDSLVVRKEYRPSSESERVDLYISDGSGVIVIENKLNALDQPGQVKRYLKAVGADTGERSKETLFIYLTKGRVFPSASALKYPENKEKGIPRDQEPLKLFAKEYLGTSEACPWALYQNLSYRKFSDSVSIHAWLEACHDEVQELPGSENLIWAIHEYQDVVRKATREYSSNVESLKEHLQKMSSGRGDFHSKAIQMAKELNKAHADWLHEAMTDSLNDFLDDEIRSGLLTRVHSGNTGELVPYVKEKTPEKKISDLVYRLNGNFFSKGKARKGAFFIVKKGAFADRMMLMLFYGSKNIHVGFVTRDGDSDALAVAKRVGLVDRSNEVKESALQRTWFPNAHTQYEDLAEKGIVSLSKFNESTQAKMLTKIIKEISSDNDKDCTNDL